MTTGRRAVWVDFGGVLTPPVAETVAAFCARVGVPAEQLGAAMVAVARSYGTEDVMEPLDTPLATEAEWGERMEAELLRAFDVRADLSSFSEKWFADRPPNAPLVDYLREVRGRGHFVGMLSNMPPAWEPHASAMVPAEGLFDDLVYSARVGVRKPQAAIFELSAGRAGAAPADCVLIDDLEPNCAGAEAAGWAAIRYATVEATVERLEAWLAAAG